MMAEHELRCCCGRPSCAFLEHNNAALGVLERELDMAARMGQVRTFLRLQCASVALHLECDLAGRTCVIKSEMTVASMRVYPA